MKTTATLCLLLASFLFLGAGTLAAENKDAPPPPPSGIVMNHAYKTNTLMFGCDTCHTPNPKDARLMTLPTMDTCADCHSPATDKTGDKAGCVVCHTNADYHAQMRKDRALMPQIVFSHTTHAAANVDCQACHKILDKNGVYGDEMLPKMADCEACHTAKQVKNGTSCATCHTDNVVTARPTSHTPLWDKTHGRNLSKTAALACAQCHTKASGNDCDSCHQREAPASHTQSFDLGTHGLAAKTDRASCAVCHTENQCIACHTTQPPSTHTGSWGSPMDNHCYTCHFSNLGANGYASGALGSNCTVCHTGGQVIGAHKSVPRPADHLGAGLMGHTNCALCHAGGAGSGPTRIPHPYPTSGGAANSAQCLACHQ